MADKAGPNARIRPCETCGTSFRPRLAQLRLGQGRFCSQRCNTAFRTASLTPEALAKRSETRRRMEKEGRIKRYRGAENPLWKGGKAARVARYVESGASAEQVRRYRKANPDKVREFSRRRAGRKLDRLPYGTIPRLRAAQNNMCALCDVSIAEKSHLDHIMPLARGGRHVPENLQLLCPPCNLHKSDRDPAAFIKASPRRAQIEQAMRERQS